MSVNAPVKDEERLVQNNIGLVVHLAKSFHPHNADELDEYIQVGRIGLLKAIRKHEPKKGAALQTLAWNHIRWEIIRHLKKQKVQLSPLQEPHYYPTEGLWEYLPDTLTTKEKRVIDLKLEGYTFKEIGKELAEKRIKGTPEGGLVDCTVLHLVK